MKPEIEYLPDDRVDDALDRELRGLLSTCFTKPQDVVFRSRRYFLEPYPHRWVIRDAEGKVVSHIGVHEKTAEAGGRTYRVGGVAEVCVHPDHRGRGHVKAILACVHTWLADRGFAFAVLYGASEVYGSSGYTLATNLFNGGGEDGWMHAPGLVRALSDTPWPEGRVCMPGPGF